MLRILLLLFLAFPAQAEITTHQNHRFGAWDLLRREDLSTGYTLCMMRHDSPRAAVVLGFDGITDASLMVQGLNPDFQRLLQQAYTGGDLSVTVNQRRYALRITENNTIDKFFQVNLGLGLQLSQFVQDWASASDMTLRWGHDAVWRVPLHGTSAALVPLARCVERVREINTPPLRRQRT